MEVICLPVKIASFLWTWVQCWDCLAAAQAKSQLSPLLHGELNKDRSTLMSYS